MKLDNYVQSKVRWHLGYNLTSVPAGDQARLEEAQHEIERLKADAPSKDTVTIAKGCNYSVGYVRSCEVLKNSEGKEWAIKMPVGFTVGANINLLDQSIPADAEPTWKNVPITPSGKSPFFVYRKDDFMELKALIDNSEFLTLALQWKHKWNWWYYCTRWYWWYWCRWWRVVSVTN